MPRHEFVPPPLARYAYEDTPLPIEIDQNLAAPFLAALMTHLLRVKAGDTVFETGTDCGYQAAVLAELGAQVYSIEVSEALAAAAAERLKRLDYRGVLVKAGDGYFGWAEHGPYDAILVKEAVDHVPVPLLAQLKPGGRMVVPIGSRRRAGADAGREGPGGQGAPHDRAAGAVHAAARRGQDVAWKVPSMRPRATETQSHRGTQRTRGPQMNADKKGSTQID